MTTTTENKEKVALAVPRNIELRDWFAGQALAGMCEHGVWPADNFISLASYAYEAADAMLRARGGSDAE